ncbi:hypothetical protein [Mycoplasma seminis]|uniref:Uncharacterized protein n=1 Tax=Mycoplasma seminis TaxID=512749 RepID=A0ABY9HCK5_9MOLU|nr:hypothetical protein [Mycoplasma seminis]WLP85413.1 hypothetical protein Q8852_03770 [Mycoplasma seminis]
MPLKLRNSGEEINRNNIILSITKKRSTPPQFPYLWKDIKKA